MNIKEHEGQKYLFWVTSPVTGERIQVDVYSIIEGVGITNCAQEHALKKCLFAGRRGKGSKIADFEGIIAAIHRAIEIEKDREKYNSGQLQINLTVDTVEYTEKVKETIAAAREIMVGHKKSDVRWTAEGPHYEIYAAMENERVIGYQVRWSRPHPESGKYFWCGHYFADQNNTLRWCEHAAERQAELWNDERKIPKGIDGEEAAAYGFI